MSHRVAKQIFYSGQVQGVGFRATTESIAKRYKVGGYVKNLSDGRVELFVEAEDERDIDDFLAEVYKTLGRHILDSLKSKTEALDLKNFVIR